VKAEVRQGIESPDSLMPPVVCESMKDHTTGFWQSPAIEELGPLLARQISRSCSQASSFPSDWPLGNTASSSAANGKHRL